MTPDSGSSPRSSRPPSSPPEELEAAAPAVAPLLPAVVHGDVIERIRGDLSLPQVDHPRVDREIEWLQRNPDYLAGELLAMVEADGLPADEYVPVIEYLLESPEPDLHWYPMPRWHHGAYEAIDDAFSMLSAYGP